MNRDDVLALISEIEMIIRGQLGEVGVNAVRPVLRRVAESACATFTPRWMDNEVQTDEAGRRYVDSRAMMRECRRHNIAVDGRYLAMYGYVPGRKYRDGVRIRAWFLPDVTSPHG